VRYKAIVFKKDEHGNQYVITNDDDSVFKSNLYDNEVIIDKLVSKLCPIKQICVNYIKKDDLSLFCEHFRGFFQTALDQYDFESFFCNKGKKYREVSQLKPLNCSKENENCIGCEKLSSVEVISYPEKSNSHVVCI
jgi:hypothetical protein